MNFSNPDIAQIMSIESNNSCVDCLAPNPTFTSVNNAVFICENCAKLHRPLGPNISLVKSLINDQFTPQEISLLKIGGNLRFNTLMSEYGITSDQNKEFKYHLKLANYYRTLLLAELNKENNANEYQQLLNNQPNPEIALQIMESVTEDSINQAQQQQNEIYKDASVLGGKISGFFSTLGTAISDVMNQYGINQTINTAKEKISEEAKTFGENHPEIQNVAYTAMEGIKTAGNIIVETANKIVNSEPVQAISQKANQQYQAVMNSETVKNLSKKAEEQYITLKAKAVEKFGSSNNQNPQPQV